MLPPEHSTPRLEYLRGIVLKIGVEELYRFPLPTDEQLLQMMRFIQLYNYIELNERRCVEMLASVGLLNLTEKDLRNLRTSALCKTLKSAIANMDHSIEAIDNSIAKLTELERRRPFRNLFAHFAARQLPGEDALFFSSINRQDFERVFGRTPHEDSMMWAVADMAGIRSLVQHVDGYQKWIALKAAEWWKRYKSAA